VWNEIVGDLWRTDATFFGIRPDPPRKHDLFTAPWHLRPAPPHRPDQLWEWIKASGVGPSVQLERRRDRGAVVIFVSSHQRRRRAATVHWLRGLLFVVFVVGMALVFAASGSTGPRRATMSSPRSKRATSCRSSCSSH
jgi:hypothetical protein